MELKIRLAQMEIIAGDPRNNFETAKLIINQAKQEKVDILVFPELILSGYLIGDLWEELSFLDDCEYYGNEIAKLSNESLAIVFGNVYVDRELTGTDGRVVKLNGAFFASNGEFKKFPYGGIVYPKSLLPNYREFEEPRHFRDSTWYSLHKYNSLTNKCLYPIEYKGTKIGITICEDGWDKDYRHKPIKSLVQSGAEIIFNLSCSPFTLNKNVSRDRTFSAHARDNNTPVLYVNSVGLQNNGKTLYTFDGCSVVYDSDGEIVNQLNAFEMNVLDVKFNTIGGYVCKVTDNVYPVQSESAQIYNALVHAIRSYMSQCGLKRVVIGSSGGVDSAVASALYVDAIGSNNVYLVNMPSKYNSDTTKNLSHKLAVNLGCHYLTVPIQDSVELTVAQINNACFINMNSGVESPLTLSELNIENIQARDRSARILSAIASSLGAVFTNNGNKTEVSLGYATLYGDVCGFMATIGDLWKEQVYALGAYINELHKREMIPCDIFTIVPSAELSDKQNVDEGKGDPMIYWYHDRLMSAFTERWNRVTPEDVLRWYLIGDIEKELKLPHSIDTIFATPALFIDNLEKFWIQFKGMALAKRVQAPPIVAISRRSFGYDYRESLNCGYLSRKYYQMKERVLKA